MERKFTLRVTGPSGDQRVFPLGMQPVFLGHAEKCTIILVGPGVEPRHARVRLTSKGFIIEDGNTRAGLKVNGQPTRQSVLKPGDVVELGGHRIELLSGTGAPAAPAAPARPPPPPRPAPPPASDDGDDPLNLLESRDEEVFESRLLGGLMEGGDTRAVERARQSGNPAPAPRGGDPRPVVGKEEPGIIMNAGNDLSAYRDRLSSLMAQLPTMDAGSAPMSPRASPAIHPDVGAPAPADLGPMMGLGPMVIGDNESSIMIPVPVLEDDRGYQGGGYPEQNYGGGSYAGGMGTTQGPPGSLLGGLDPGAGYAPSQDRLPGPAVPGQGFPGPGFPDQGFRAQGSPDQGFPTQGPTFPAHGFPGFEPTGYGGGGGVVGGGGGYPQPGPQVPVHGGMGAEGSQRGPGPGGDPQGGRVVHEVFARDTGGYNRPGESGGSWSQKSSQPMECLEFLEVSPADLDIGGMDQIKKWSRSRQKGFDPRAREFGLPEPRGALFLGLPGCGKKQMTRALAHLFRFPLARLTLDQLVVEDPKVWIPSIRNTIQVIERRAPLVVMLDDIDRVIETCQQGSPELADQGFRLVNTLVSWMEQRTASLFVVVTGSKLRFIHPNLVRRRKAVDQVFFIDVPSAGERAVILEICLKKKGRNVGAFDMRDLVMASEGLTGEEIQRAVNFGLYEAFTEDRELTSGDILRAYRETPPVFRRMAPDLAELRQRCMEFAINAGMPVEPAVPQGRVTPLSTGRKGA